MMPTRPFNETLLTTLLLTLLAGCHTREGDLILTWDAGPNSNAALTIAGRTRPGAEVAVEVGSDVYRASVDAQGDYRLDLPSLSGDPLLILRAQGAAAMGDGHVELYSILDTWSAVQLRAGADSVLDATEHRATIIDGLSTMRAAALAAAQGQLPTSRAEVIAAERSFNQRLGPTTLLDGAVLLDQIAASVSGFVLPTGYATTWQLATDLGELRDTVRSLQPGSFERFGSYTPPLSAAGPLTAPRTALLRSSDRFSSLSPDGEYIAEWRLRSGSLVGGSGERYIFDPQRQGSYQAAPNIQGLLPKVDSIAWTASPNWLLVDFASPATLNLRVDADTLVDLVDPQLENEVRTKLGLRFPILPCRRLSSRFLRIGEGINVEWLARWDEWEYAVDQVLAPFGIVAPSVRREELGPATVWTRRSAVASQPLQTADVVGRWVLNVQAPSDRRLRDVYGLVPLSVDAGETAIYHAFVDFAANGTGTAELGVTGRPAPLNWQVDSRGALELTRLGGAKQSLELIESSPEELGFLHTQSSTTVISHYRRAIRADSNLILTQALLVPPTGKYWQTTLFAPVQEATNTGPFPRDEIFGFIFEPGGRLRRVQADGSLNVRTDNDGYSWRIDGGKLYMELFVDRNNEWGPCLSRDPSCLPVRRRVWEPVALSNNHLYVLESRGTVWEEEIRAGEHSWDDVRGAWINADGETLDVEEPKYWWFPRLNAYRLEDIPSNP